MYDGPSSSIHDNFNGVSYSDHTDYVVSNDQVGQAKLDQHNYKYEYHEPYIWKETTVEDIKQIYRDCFGEELPESDEKLIEDDCGYPIEVDTSENFEALTDKYLAYRDKCKLLETRIHNLEDTIVKMSQHNKHIDEQLIVYKITSIVLGIIVIVPIVFYLLGVRI